MEHELLTVDEIAARLKLKKSWIYAHSRETGPGSIPRTKIGKYLRFNETEVMAWIKETYGEDK